ncbi:MAG: (Na+)-NQR maturation NqrM [Spongiibacteraceae bacterium]|nr:(Na+)-NQR maturation NqrM [Spongiibacteraceae bacterium]
MTIVFVTFAVMLLVVSAMAIGVLLGRKPIQGSCGGMSALGMETDCDICGGDQTICDEENKKSEQLPKSDLAYNAAVKK